MARNAYIKKYVKNTAVISIPLRDPVERFLEDLVLKRYSDSTLCSYGAVFRKFFPFIAGSGRERVPEVTSGDLESYMQHLKKADLSESSVDIHMRSLRKFFAFLEEQGELFVSPLRDLVLPRLVRKTGYVPPFSDIRTLLSLPDVSTAVGLRNRAVLETIYSCGLRSREALSLNVRCPDLKNRTLRILGKGKKERVVPLGKQAVRWISRYLDQARDELLKGNPDEEALWVDQYGHRMKKGSLDTAFHKYCSAAGITRISAHALRRACATHMLQNGAHPVQIQMLLGHADVSTLSQYLQVSVADLKKSHSRSRTGK